MSLFKTSLISYKLAKENWIPLKLFSFRICRQQSANTCMITITRGCCCILVLMTIYRRRHYNSTDSNILAGRQNMYKWKYFVRNTFLLGVKISLVCFLQWWYPIYLCNEMFQHFLKMCVATFLTRYWPSWLVRRP